MAFPIIAGTAESSTNTAGTSHVLDWTGLGTVAAGNLLIIILAKGSTAATINAHADWTELLDENSANGLYIAYRWATGGEAAPTLTTSASTRSAEITYRITGAANPATTAPQIGTTGTGTSATPDPPASAAPPSTKDYLFIAFYGAAGEEADDDTWSGTPPTNYTPSPPRQKSCGIAGINLAGLIAAAERALTTGAAEDPGTFAKDVSVAWRSQTITVHPDLNVTLGAGANTVTISAPDVPSLVLTMPQGANTVTITAPAQSQLVAITLAAGQNTVAVTAPDATGVFGSGGTTLAAGQNTVTVSAPAQSQLVEITLAAGQNTVTISAPTVPAVHLTMPQTVNTITVSAPTVPAVHLTMPQTVNTVTISAPAQSQLAAISLAAGQNTVTLNAPAQSQIVAAFITAGQNTVTISAPTALLDNGGGATLVAAANTITLSAPAQSQIIVVPLQAGQNMVTIMAPTITFQPTWTGVLRKKHEARVTQTVPSTSVVQPLARLSADISQVVLSREIMVE